MVLDDNVKRKINNARDILVGKVPDPKAQIEQITIALIYKFMDDMDKKLGTRIYFKDELKNYSWDEVLNEKDSATFFDKYVKAIDLFQRAAHFPKFFQEVFKNAYVPYKDSRTLKLFLTEMSYFDYEHSEKLGDAFEYLLSVMGSQGDAGQFRTPRHIIDFIVEIFEPKIGEKILDPACGTAGFLISAVKNMESRHGKLGRVDLNNIRDNLFGFDISPDMVRLALVNMFLHGFSDPQIEEFDTLSSDKKWNDRYDLILANPPFMSPKGGIEPHDLLLTACDSTRAEVLFTSYILTHLKEKGRAGIIVPEGIIFQSGKAYKKLREELVKKGLFAVVSLPSGVFNPYSGVKTSILLIDKKIKSEDILFIKIEGDGLDLGAQRRENGKNDLPLALEIIKKYRKTQEFEENSLSHLVPKSKIAENGEYNLSGDRYKETLVHSGSYPMVELGEIATIKKGSSITKDKAVEGDYPVIAGGQQPSCYHNEFNREGKIITVSASGAYAGFVNYFETPIFASDCSTIQSLDENKVSTRYIFLVLKTKQQDIYKLQMGMGQPHVYPKDLVKIKIPLPPIEVQKKIVEEIESDQKIIDGAKLVVENYKPRIEIDSDWEMKELGELCEMVRGGSPRPIQDYLTNDENGINWIKIGDTKNVTKYICSTKQKIKPEGLKKSRLVKEGDFILSNSMSFGKPYIMKTTGAIHDGWLLLRIKNKNILLQDYLYYGLISDYLYSQFVNTATGSSVNNLNITKVKECIIPLPPLETQEQIVKQIETEQKLVDSNKELITIFEKKIENVINKVWKE